MKKLFIPIIVLLTLSLGACSGTESANTSNASDTTKETITYESETGPVEVPDEPKRIVALTNGPNVLSLDGNIVGIDQWTKKQSSLSRKIRRCGSRF